MSQAQLEKKVMDYLRKSQALEDYWQRPITADQLQVEMDRMAKHTKQPEILNELFEALGDDPFVIAECLVRPVLAVRLIAHPALGTNGTLLSQRATPARLVLGDTFGVGHFLQWDADAYTETFTRQLASDCDPSGYLRA